MKRSKKTAAVDTAAGRLSVSNWPAAEGLIEKVDPYRKQFTDTVGPLADQARRSGAQAAHTALERVTPVLDDAWERLTPAVESARVKVQGDLLPRLNTALAEASGHPVAQEAARRGRATAAALRGDLEVAEPKKKGGKVRKVFGVLAIVAAVGGAVVAVKKYLDSRDAEWEAPAPSTYGGSNAPKRAGTSPWAASTDQVKPSATTPTAGLAAPAGGSSSAASSTAASSSAATTPATPASAEDKSDKSDTAGTSDTTADTSDTAADEPVERKTYGAGSYVGSKPPKGFEIKGNERSMKYHTPDSPAYERTISDVWFNSTEAAENNGFTRAQR